MALIRCPECGKEISDSVKCCLYCGYRRKKKIPRLILDEGQKKCIIITCLIVIIMIVTILGGYFALSLNSSQKERVETLNNQMEECLKTKTAGQTENQLRIYKGECLKLIKDYNKMSWKERIRVSERKSVNKRIKEIDSTVQKIRNDAVAAVSKKIDALDNVSLESKDAIDEIESAYSQLDEDQKKEVKNYATLEEVKEQYNSLCVQEAVSLIGKIGEVTLENGAGEKIEKAESVYSGLTGENQEKVTNYQTLVAKRNKYNKLDQYRKYLQKANTNMSEGNLNKADKYLKKVPSKFKYKTLKASRLKKRLRTKNAWMKLCGRWKSTSGSMLVYQIYDETGSWESWKRKIGRGEEDITVRCKLLDNGKVKLEIRGSLPRYTEYSSISEGLETGSVDLDKNITVSKMGTIRIDKYTTMTLSTSGISVNYNEVNPNEAQYFTYRYTSSMRCGKHSAKF